MASLAYAGAEGEVEATAHLAGVPEGIHGFHVHENGSCEEAGKAAGGLGAEL